jgi:C4-dicarboxylate-specific signal transduction histidine kinase
MEEALTLGTALSENASIRIVREYGEPFFVLAHPSGLLHALVNLVRNACEAMLEEPPKDALLSVSLLREGDRGVFRIRDNGIGMEDEQIKTLFLLGHTTKPNGHGIGLHVSANDISAMGGSIRAYSEGSSHGATFEIRMPLMPE